MAALSTLLDISGIGRERIYIKWVSSAEGKLFAEYAEQISRAIELIGPFDKDKWRLPLAAIRRILSATRIRWLMGMERHLEEDGNVYGEKITPERFRPLLNRAMREEYEKALVLETLTRKDGRLVGQIADATGLAVPKVATCLMDLEREGLAGVECYEDRHPKLIRLCE